MNIAVISDVHGNYNALKCVIDDIKKKKINSVIVLGDIIFSGEEPQKCFDTIKKLKPLAWIKGNTDNWFNEIDENFKPENEVEDKIYRKFIKVNKVISTDVSKTMRKLKGKEEIQIGGKRILCVHGSDRKIDESIGIVTPQKDMNGLIHRLECDILLCGHTHLPYTAFSHGKIIMNVGSVGLPKDEPKASYGILTFDSDNFEYSIRKISIN